MCVLFMKNFLSPIRATWWVLHSFRPPEPKNVWFLLSRHHVRGVHEKFSSRWFERAICRLTHFGLLSPRTFHSYFLDIMYVDIIKKIFLAHSSELMGVKLISASWAKNAWFLLSRHDVRRVHEKFSSRRFERAICCLTHFGLLSPNTFDSYFTDTMYVEGMKNFFYPFERTDGCYTHFGFLSPKTFDSYFLDMMYIKFMKNFLLDDSGELFAVWLISASWAQKRLIPTLQTSCTSNSWENFFRPIRANWWVLDSFRPPEPKNVSFLLSRHHVRPVHEKFSFADSSDLMGIRLISASWPKNVCFLLSRHDLRRVHEKFSSGRFGRAIGCFTHFGLLSPKTFDLYVEFMRKFFLADSSELMGARLIFASWAQKRLIPIF